MSDALTFLRNLLGAHGGYVRPTDEALSEQGAVPGQPWRGNAVWVFEDGSTIIVNDAWAITG